MLKKNLDPINPAKQSLKQVGNGVGISKKELVEDHENIDVELTQIEGNGAANTGRRLLKAEEAGHEHEPAEVTRGQPTGEFDNDWKLTYKLSLRAENLQYSKLMSYIEKLQPLNPDTRRHYSYCGSPFVLNGLLSRLFNPFYCCLVNSNRNGRAGKCCGGKKGQDKAQGGADAKAAGGAPPTPEEESDPDDDETPALQIGEGSTFYLQHLRAMTCLFLLLTIINLPVLVLFGLNDNAREVTGLYDALSYFSLANIGESSLGCTYKSLDIAQYTAECPCTGSDCSGATSQPAKPEPAKGANGIPISQQKLVLKCPSGGKISAINEFGFLNPQHYSPGRPVDPDQVCKTASDPTYWPESSWKVFSTKEEYEVRYEQQEKAKEALGSPRTTRINEFNVDNECQFNKMFKNDGMRAKMREYVESRCLDRSACHIELDMGAALPFFDELTCKCRERIAAKETSHHLSIFFQCSSEYVGVQVGRHVYDDPSRLDFKLHRSLALLLYYCINFLVICLVIRAIVGLRTMNDEKYRSMQASAISASDYTFQIENIQLDKYSQNLQILQMKIWLHLLDYFKATKVFNHEDGQQKEDGTELVEQDLEILDININTKHASELDDILVQMQAIEQGKNYIGRSVQKKFTTMEEYDMYMNIYDELQGNYVKKKEQYKQLVRTRHENNEDFKKMPAEKRVKQVDQIYVTMSHRHFARKVHQQWPTKAPNFQDQILQVSQAPDPDQILWSNQQVAYSSRRCRICLLVLQLVLFIAAILAINYVLLYKQREYEKAGVISELMECSEFSNWASLDEFRAQAINHFNQIKEAKKKDGEKEFRDLGEIGCYCKHLKENTEQDLAAVKFEGFGDRQFCTEWNDAQAEYFWYRLVYPVLFVFVLNGPVAYLLTSAVASLRIRAMPKHSKVEFLCIFLFECIGIGFTFLVSTALQQAWDHSDQWQRGIDHAWYQEFGSTVCLVIILHIFSSNTFEWLRYLAKTCVRCKDRDFRCRIRQPPKEGEETSDRVWSRQRTQQQLNSLYEGVDFAIVRTYARMNSIVFVALVFAPGMPLLYLIGFLWCLFTYFTQKYLILFFYKRELSLKNELADASVFCLIGALLGHLVMAYLFLLNAPIRQSFLRQEDIASEHDDFLLKYFDHDKPWYRYIDYKEEYELSADASIRIEISKTLNSLDSMIFFGLLLLVVIGLLLLLGIYCCTRATLPTWRIEKLRSFDIVKKDYNNLPSQSEPTENDGNQAQNEQQIIREQPPKDVNQEMHTIDGRIDLIAEKERATAKGDEVMKQLTKSSLLNELNGFDLKDFYMRSIFVLYNFRRMFQDVNPVGQSVHEFNINFSLLEDNQIKNEIMNAVKQQSEANLKKSGHIQQNGVPEDAQNGSAVRVEEVDKVEHIFKDMCDFYQVTADQVKKYEAILNKRVHMIEMVIDNHFRVVQHLLLREELDCLEDGNKTNMKKEMLRKLQDLTYLEKLNYIVDRQDDLITSNIIDIGNPSGRPNIMRLRGSLQNSRVQSYFKFDSREFRLTKKIYYALESELVREQDEEDARRYLSFLRQEEELRNGERIEEVDEEFNGENEDQDSQIHEK